MKKYVLSFEDYIKEHMVNKLSDIKRVKNIEYKIKSQGVNAVTTDDVIGITVVNDRDNETGLYNGIPSFSDLMAFEYHENKENWKNKIALIGDNVYLFDQTGKRKRMKWLGYDMNKGTIEKSYIPQRVLDYGEDIPKSGTITVIHGSPYGKIEIFDEEMWGRGYQREEFDHERFAGVYTSDNTPDNMIVSRGYGITHLYRMTFKNSISEPDAEKLLREYEKGLGKRLNRINATNFIRGKGFDMIYRKEDNDTYIYICLDTKNIKPI